MVGFSVDPERCIGCGQCVADCPLTILEMRDGLPLLARQKQQFCIGCLHCFAVCDEAALSILGHDPLVEKECRGPMPKPAQMEMLIRGRRSIRNYQNRNLPPELIDDLLDMAWQAPTGRNVRGLLFSVVDDRTVLADIRREMLAEIQRLDEEGLIAEEYGAFAKFPLAWREGECDVLFCKAPHLLVVSARDDLPTPMQDAVIAMTTFELYAQSHGVGTLWDGLAAIALRDLVPDMQKRLGIPEGHHLCYAMCFGYPALNYARVVSRGRARVERVC